MPPPGITQDFTRNALAFNGKRLLDFNANTYLLWSVLGGIVIREGIHVLVHVEYTLGHLPHKNSVFYSDT